MSASDPIGRSYCLCLCCLIKCVVSFFLFVVAIVFWVVVLKPSFRVGGMFAPLPYHCENLNSYGRNHNLLGTRYRKICECGTLRDVPRIISNRLIVALTGPILKFAGARRTVEITGHFRYSSEIALVFGVRHFSFAASKFNYCKTFQFSLPFVKT
jgi:hypothetical protein